MAGDEDEAGAAVPAGSSNRLYLVSGAFLVLVLVAIAFMATLARDSQPVVSEVRQPLISQAPSEASRTSSEEDEPAYGQEDAESDNPGPDQRAGSPDDDRDDGEAAQAPGDATATASAPPATASAPPATETATAEPVATPQPTVPEPAGDEPTPTRPAPAASEPPAREDQAAVVGPRVGEPRVAEPARRDNGAPVKGFSITRGRDDRGLIP
jgi:cell division septation protein DedD